MSELSDVGMLHCIVPKVAACSRASELRVVALALAFLPLALGDCLCGKPAVVVAFAWLGKGDSDLGMSTTSSNRISKNK